MPYLYVVRCNFTRPDLEQSWNDWYSGDKVRQLLAKPMFRAVQRFRLASGSGRNYLALWQVASPEAFTTREYTFDWGFAEWLPYIVDWSRDLFDASNAPDEAFDVSLSGALQAISFDGMDADRARTTRDAMAGRADVMWFDSAGLDRHSPMIGLRQFADAGTAHEQPGPAGVQSGIYRPIGELHTA